VLAALASWFAIDWTDRAAADYAGGTILRDNAGNVLRVSLGPGDVDCRPWYVASGDDWIVKALVASEDGTFWTHHGVRPLSVARAFLQNIVNRRRISGASTITMQAVRLIEPHGKSYSQKWVEMVRALKMEREKDKVWILSQYLNRAPFGSNLVGIESAAQGWFGKGAKELGLGEAALLAGMVQAPSRFRPDRHLDKAMVRRDYVLSRMVECGYATEEQVEAAKSVIPDVKRSRRPFLAPHYCDWYMNEVLMRDRAAQRVSGDFTTPLDADVQSICETAVSERTDCSSAAVVMKVRTGEVVALAVSGDYFNPTNGQVNTAVAPRPAGSTLKPFLVAKALSMGIVSPDSILLDAPFAAKGYNPQNFDGKFRGEVPLRDALILSLNVPFVRLLDKVGIETFTVHLRGLGFRVPQPKGDRTHGLGLAIGSADVTLAELVAAYRELAASGSEESLVVSDMLSGEERSQAALGHIADVPLPRFAWKTGTSSAYRDAWTIAWNPEFVIGVWCGHLEGFGDESIVGAKAAAPLAWKIARALYPNADAAPWFPRPKANSPAAPKRTEVVDSPGPRLAMLSPDPGSVFRLVDGGPSQRLVAKVAGIGEGEKLWWFMDGAPAGETTGSAPYVCGLTPGEHKLSCSTASGASAETTYSVE